MAAIDKFNVGKREMDVLGLWVDSFGTGKPEFCLFPESEYRFRVEK